ncbi:MAG: DUF6973 domain-containing protein [Bacteroidales bacterium]
MKKIILSTIVCLLLNVEFVHSQGLLKHFFKVSHQERVWALTHPFIAKEAFDLSMRARAASDSVMQLPYTDSIRCDGLTDAIRHTYWMALLSSRFSAKKACKLGCAHEIANYKNFSTSLSNSDCYHDSVATAMDIHNNRVGLKIGALMKDTAYSVLLQAAIDSVKNGNCMFILRDEDGDFLDENNQPVPRSNIRGKWVTPRQLVPTKFPD